MIFAAAAGLFRERGFRGAKMEDIAAAVGMTAPAVYRHFSSKEALLAALLERAVERAQRDIAGVLALGLPPRASLEAIVRASVSQALAETELVATAARESRGLSEPVRKQIARQQRTLLRAWCDAVGKVQPGRPREEVRAAVAAVSALVTSIGRTRGLAPERATELFTRMALAALLER